MNNKYTCSATLPTALQPVPAPHNLEEPRTSQFRPLLLNYSFEQAGAHTTDEASSGVHDNTLSKLVNKAY